MLYIAAELSGILLQRKAVGSGQLLTAVSYSPRPKVVIDGGVSRGMNGASSNGMFFSGLTILFL